jgi:hypothetical protein
VKLFNPPKFKMKRDSERQDATLAKPLRSLSDQEARKEAERVYNKYRATMRNLAQ